jgi:enterochelin esterase-like enzyme
MWLRISITCLLSLPAIGFSDASVTLPLPPTGFSQTQSGIPHGTLSASIQYPTRNHGNRPVRIYTPPGYSATGTTKYPVLYLLHGIGGNENAWTSSEGNADKIIDYLLSKNLCKPMIVVMPFHNMTGTSGDTWTNFNDVLLNDLIPYVQKNYAALTDSSNRAIAGLSWGGGQALNIGFKYYTQFTYIGGFSPAPNMSSPGSVITNPAAVDKVVNFCFVSSGTNEASQGYGDRASSHHNFWNTNNITPHMYTIEPGVAHEQANWNRNLYNFAQKLFTEATTGITISQIADGKKSKVWFGRVMPGDGFSNVVAGWNDKGVFTLDGRAVPTSSKVVRSEGILQP